MDLKEEHEKNFLATKIAQATTEEAWQVEASGNIRMEAVRNFTKDKRKQANQDYEDAIKNYNGRIVAAKNERKERLA